MPYLFLSVGLYSECIQNLTIYTVMGFIYWTYSSKSTVWPKMESCFGIMVSGHIEYFKLKEFEKTAEAGRSL